MADMTLWRALNDGLRSAMAEDERVFIMGEDLTRWAAGGGIHGVTRGLLAEFGPERVRDTPISEEAILSAGVGAALAGGRPVVEIMFSDFSLLAFDAIVNQAAKARYMFGGQFDVPLVVRTASGYGPGKGAQHTQSLETIFAHVPGLEVVVPATPNDARALLRSSVASPNPTIFLEHKSLYNIRGPVDDVPVSLGRAAIVRPGRDVSIVATQLMVHRSLAVAERLAVEGIDIEIIDPRTLYPLDLDTILSSARKTHRVFVCHEAPEMFGFGGEIAASVAEACWTTLEAPVQRLGGARAPMPYSAELEAAVIPSETRIEVAVRELAGRRRFHLAQSGGRNLKTEELKDA